MILPIRLEHRVLENGKVHYFNSNGISFIYPRETNHLSKYQVEYALGALRRKSGCVIEAAKILAEEGMSVSKPTLLKIRRLTEEKPQLKELAVQYA